ncbi:MAG: hypothetical protein U9Q69_03610 [Nanoarchaeota archaeon]|nr:hypothetical protein [Nanoarchaeota archaeon]
MIIKTLKSTLDRLDTALANIQHYNDFANGSNIEFKKIKFQNNNRLAKIQVKYLEDNIWELLKLGDNKNLRPAILSIIKLIKQLKEDMASENFQEVASIIKEIRSLLPVQNKEFSFELKTAMPKEIKSEIYADLNEMNRCYHAECYRSAVIICGRLMETSLHRKYFEATGKDLLEKSPGIGLGKLIAKLMEAQVPLIPGLTQQIHLINQLRIFSVHTKQSAFYPTKAQANAIILYTLDAIKQLFPN